MRSLRFFLLLLILPASKSAYCQDVLLETIGVMGAQGIYSGYTSIGSMADGYHGEIYDATFTSQLLGECATLMQLSAVQMDKLLESNVLSEPDAQFIAQLGVGYRLLHTQSLAYQDYILTGKEDSLTAYEKNRKEAWALISSLLGLEENQK